MPCPNNYRMPGKDSNKKYLTKLRSNINVTFCATYGLGKQENPYQIGACSFTKAQVVIAGDSSKHDGDP